MSEGKAPSLELPAGMTYWGWISGIWIPVWKGGGRYYSSNYFCVMGLVTIKSDKTTSLSSLTILSASYPYTQFSCLHTHFFKTGFPISTKMSIPDILPIII